MTEDKKKHNAWHKDSSNWILGIFYYNKDDKRIFPPKRFKELGWTINFAHPASILVFILLLITILLMAGLI